MFDTTPQQLIDRRIEASKLFDEGKSLRAIAEIISEKNGVQVSHETIRADLIKMGRDPSINRTLDGRRPQAIQTAMDLRFKNFTYAEIETKTGITPDALIKAFARRGIRPPVLARSEEMKQTLLIARELFKKKELTTKEIAKKMGRSMASVAKYKRMLNDPEVLKKCFEAQQI